VAQKTESLGAAASAKHMSL